MNVSTSESSSWKLALPYVLDIVGPIIGYAVVHGLGASGFWALSVAGVIAGLSTAINSIRRKGLDAMGVLVVLELLASIWVTLFIRDSRLLLIRPSIYTGIAATYLMVSSLRGKPLTYAGSRPMAARGGPVRLAAYERAWEKSPEFRCTHCWLTFGFAVGLAVDSLARIWIVYTQDLQRAAWLSNVPHVSAIVLMVIASAMAGRRFGRLVDEQMPPAAATSAPSSERSP